MNSDYLAERIMPDGRLAVVFHLTFGRARLGIGPPDYSGFDNVW